jgi:hypothetical protein
MSQGVPEVHLAITVPQLMLIDKASVSQSEVDTGQHIDHPAQVAGNQQPVATERIEIQLLTIGTQKHPDSPQDDSSKQLMDTKLSPLTLQTKQFSIFHAKDIPAQGEILLLRVLRQWMVGNHSRPDNTHQNEQFQRSDEMAFSVEFHHIDEATEIAHLSDLQTGSSRVVIFLDEEGKPCSYSIDGAES